MIEFASQILLPATLFFMMFTMGLSLTTQDFLRIAENPKSFMLGLFNQLIVLPCVAFTLITLFNVEPKYAIGFMILAACPGGIVSNVISYFGRADVALSISLTAGASILALLTIPFIVGLSFTHFQIDQEIKEFPYLQLTVTLLITTLIPVLTGMYVRFKKEATALKLLPMLDKITATLIIVVVSTSVLSNWQETAANFEALGIVLICFGFILISWGFGSARLAGLNMRSSATIAFETSIQNVATAILIGGSVLQDPSYYLPAALYAFVMYMPVGALVFYMRRKFK